MMGLVQTMQDRGPDDDNLGAFYGYSGYGKSEAVRFAHIKTGGPRLEIDVTWTKKDLVANLLFELGVHKPKGTLSELTRKAIELLSVPDHPPVFIDEADKLVDRNMIENLRAITDKSRPPSSSSERRRCRTSSPVSSASMAASSAGCRPSRSTWRIAASSPSAPACSSTTTRWRSSAALPRAARGWSSTTSTTSASRSWPRGASPR